MSNNAGGMYSDALQQYAINPAHDNRPFSEEYHHWMGYPCKKIKTPVLACGRLEGNEE